MSEWTIPHHVQKNTYFLQHKTRREQYKAAIRIAGYSQTSENLTNDLVYYYCVTRYVAEIQKPRFPYANLYLSWCELMELQASRVLKGKWTQQPALKDEVAVLLQVGEVEVNKGRRENGRKTRRAKRAAKFLDLQEKRSKFCLTTRGQKFHTALHCTEEGPEKSTLHCTALQCTLHCTHL